MLLLLLRQQQQQQQQGHGNVTDPGFFWRLDLENAAPTDKVGGGGGNSSFFRKGDLAFCVCMQKMVFARGFWTRGRAKNGWFSSEKWL